MKKVCFAKKATMYWLVNYPESSQEARKTYWMKIARDRLRFERRIRQVEKQIGTCLLHKIL